MIALAGKKLTVTMERVFVSRIGLQNLTVCACRLIDLAFLMKICRFLQCVREGPHIKSPAQIGAASRRDNVAMKPLLLDAE